MKIGTSASLSNEILPSVIQPTACEPRAPMTCPLGAQQQATLSSQGNNAENSVYHYVVPFPAT